jgi:hypothetical protein
MGAVDDAKKYLSLRPPMENKTIFALHPDVLVAGLLDEIERLRNVNKAQAKWLYDEQQAHKALRDKVRQWLRDDKPDILKEGE